LHALDAWLVVGRGDDLDEVIGSWAGERGYHGFKLKTHGDDPVADARWTTEVYRAARKHGVARPRLSADSNEGNTSVQSVLEYLESLRRIDPEAYAALEYLEQPTRRDIPLAEQDWRPVTRLKPVFLDEGLVDADDFAAAQDAGWSGFAVKTCKGHSFCLIAAAWARLHGLALVMQDLTNPGFAAIHSALFAAHIHPRNGVELNSPQHTPQANAQWLPRLQPLLEPRDGLHRLPDPLPDGLGSSL
jgi:L-alanine-DL-glutamate epimerase-like enolase superfamily enzyme